MFEAKLLQYRSIYFIEVHFSVGSLKLSALIRPFKIQEAETTPFALVTVNNYIF